MLPLYKIKLRFYHYGVRGLPLQLLHSYLSNHSQKLLFNRKISKSLYQNCGVPQGLILGPLLFLIDVNDFPKCLTTEKLLMFADDTNVFFSEETFEKLFAVANQQLKNIDNWLISNKLSLNIDKTHYIIFHTPHSKIPENTNLQLKNANLKRAQCIKFLGVFVNENLSWKPQMVWLLQKTKVCYGIVRKIQPYLNKKTLLLYNALIKSHLQYCILTWYNENKLWLKSFSQQQTILLD